MARGVCCQLLAHQQLSCLHPEHLTYLYHHLLFDSFILSSVFHFFKKKMCIYAMYVHNVYVYMGEIILHMCMRENYVCVVFVCVCVHACSCECRHTHAMGCVQRSEDNCGCPSSLYTLRQSCLYNKQLYPLRHLPGLFLPFLFRVCTFMRTCVSACM